MRTVVLRSVLRGLIWALGVLAIKPSYMLGATIAERLHPHVIWLDVR